MYPVSVFGGFFLRPQEHCSVVIRCCLYLVCLLENWAAGNPIIRHEDPSIYRAFDVYRWKKVCICRWAALPEGVLTLRQGGGCEGHGGFVGSGNWRCGAGDDAANRVSHYSHPTELDALPEVLLGAFVANSWLKIILETLMN